MTNLVDFEVTDADLAALVGCSARYVRKLASEGKIRRVGRNTFVLGDALQAVIQEMTAGGGGAKQLMAERVRKLSADATLSELALAKARGEVAPVADFERAQSLRFALIRARMMQIPYRAVVQIVAERDEAKIKSVLAAEIHQALTEAADQEIDETELEENQTDDDNE